MSSTMSAALNSVLAQGPSSSISVCRRCIFQSHKYWNPLACKPRKLQVVRLNLQQFPHADAFEDLLSHAPLAVQGFVSRAEGLLYTLADSAVATDAADTIKKQNGDWFSGIANSLEGFLKVLKNGLEAVHIPYAYGFAIILLTILVKAATFPLTKQQVESTMAIQNLQPKIKSIQQKYAGNQEMIQLETARLYKQAGVNPLAGCLPTLATIPVWIGLYRALSNVADEGLLTEGFFWIPSLAGPTTIAARQNGSGISWLFPFVGGHPPLGWADTLAYLVLPVLLIASQYISMQIMQPSQANDPNQKSTQAVLKFLPLMVGYFSLSVPSGLSLYWLTNNILSTGQQVWLRKLGGAKPSVSQDFDRTQSVEESTPTKSQLVADAHKPPLSRLVADPNNPVKSQLVADPNKRRRGERFKQLKEEESRRKREREEAARKQVEATYEAVDVADDHAHSMQLGGKAQIVNSLLGSDDACIADETKKKEQTLNCCVEKEELTDLYIDSGNGSGATSVNSSQSINKQSKQRGAA